jgi:PAS domain S-box-containing protein
MKDSAYQQTLNRSLTESDRAEYNLRLADNILFERVEMLYRMSMAGFIATFANMAVVVIGLWGHDDNRTLVVWAASALIVSGMRFALVKIYQNRRAGPDQARRWELLFSYGSLAMGLIWAALAWFFFPQADMLHRFLIILVLAGMTAGSTGSLAPSLFAYLGFNIPPVATMAFLMFSIDEKTYSMMGLLILVYIVVQTRFAHHYRLGIDQTTMARFRNEALHAQVKQAEKRLTDAIESFPEGFALFDIDDQLILCNSKYIEEHGKPAGIESLIGMKFSDLARLAVEKGEVSESETGLRSYFLRGNPSGRGSIRLTRQGDIITMHSDTLRARTNADSFSAAQLLNDTLFSISQEGIAVIQNGIIVSNNPKLEQLMGYRAGELVSRPVQAVSPQFSDGINASIYMQLQDGQSHRGKIELLKKDASLLHCHYSSKATDPNDMKQATVWAFTEIRH